MLRAFAFLLLSGAAANAQSFPCPHISFGWAKNWPTGSPITSASYDTAAKTLYFTFAYTIPEAYALVPTTIMQTLSNTNSPYQIYVAVQSQYNQILLTQKQNCPVLQQNGQYVYTNKVPLNFFSLILQENRRPILQETGQYWMYAQNGYPSSSNPVAFHLVLLQENEAPLLQENGGYLELY